MRRIATLALVLCSLFISYALGRRQRASPTTQERSNGGVVDGEGATEWPSTLPFLSVSLKDVTRAIKVLTKALDDQYLHAADVDIALHDLECNAEGIVECVRWMRTNPSPWPSDE
ncbi:hypothetical protein Acsp05_19900 [Actinokineospora sp. NBRC 105648]|nr:hypothetical protein Acsp05_19900 [Actinokineospora sp. NBRC 105648]